MGRREFLMVASAAVASARGRGVWRRAKEIVRGGGLGNVAFCRIVDAGGSDTLDVARFILDQPVRRPAAARATVRYPGLVASYERAGSGEGEVWFYGSEGTLRVNRGGVQVWKAEA